MAVSLIFDIYTIMVQLFLASFQSSSISASVMSASRLPCSFALAST